MCNDNEGEERVFSERFRTERLTEASLVWEPVSFAKYQLDSESSCPPRTKKLQYEKGVDLFFAKILFYICTGANGFLFDAYAFFLIMGGQ